MNTYFQYIPKRKVVSIVALLGLVFTSCQEKQSHPTNSQTEELVVIIKPVEHPSLNATIDGFKRGLDEKLGSSNRPRIEIMDANGNWANLGALVKSAVAKQPKLIFTVTTPAASEAIRITNKKIPLVYAAVTDPVKAQIVSSMEASSSDATGVSDRYPVDQQVALFVEIAHTAQTFAILFNPSEENSVILVAETKSKLAEKGKTGLLLEVSRASDLSAICKAALEKADAVIVNGDNLVTENLHIVVKACANAKKPLFVGDPDSVRQGAVATVGPSYFQMGQQAADQAAKILQGHPAGSIPSQFPKTFTTTINLQAANQMGVRIAPAVWEKGSLWQTVND